MEPIDAFDSALKLDNGILYYHEDRFTGNLVSYYTHKGLKTDIEYKNGKKHGYEKQWDNNSNIIIERYYTNGKKVGLHKGWWNNGNIKFLYEFNAKGQYHGAVKEWYESGQMYRDFNYQEGQEVGRQRLWKADGRIKSNYDVVNGERFGLIGLKMCYQVTVDSDEIK